MKSYRGKLGVHSDHPRRRTKMQLDMVGGLWVEVLSVKFHQNWPSGYRDVKDWNLPISTALAIGLCNSRTGCECEHSINQLPFALLALVRFCCYMLSIVDVTFAAGMIHHVTKRSVVCNIWYSNERVWRWVDAVPNAITDHHPSLMALHYSSSSSSRQCAVDGDHQVTNQLTADWLSNHCHDVSQTDQHWTWPVHTHPAQTLHHRRSIDAHTAATFHPTSFLKCRKCYMR